jgi:RNA polymerase sigma-70 factor (ECF subfamily)
MPQAFPEGALSAAGVAAGVPEAQVAPDATMDRVYRDHAEYVWRVLRRIGVPDALVDDACHDVFLVAHRKIAGFDRRSTLRTWLHGIAIRVGRRYRERAQRTESLPHGDSALSAQPPRQDADLQREAGLALLARVLDTMSPAHREVFVLHELEELPGREIGEILRVPMFTVYSRLRAARKHFDAALQRLQGNPP